MKKDYTHLRFIHRIKESINNQSANAIGLKPPQWSRLLFFVTVVSMMTLFMATSGEHQLMKHSKSYFIDGSVKDLQTFVEISNQEFNNAFQLFSHGKPGELYIEGEWKNAEQIAKWLSTHSRIHSFNHLNIYGCEFAKGKKGQAAVQYLEVALGVSIAASDDFTGAEGDWELEVGQPILALRLTDYPHTLQSGFIDCATILDGNLTIPYVEVVGDRVYVQVLQGENSSLPIINGIPETPSGGNNVYVAIFDLNCNQLLGTFIQGNESEGFIDWDIDAAGNIYIATKTTSTDYPVTNGTTLTADGIDYAVTKIDPNGNIVFSTFMEIEGSGELNVLEVGDDGSIYVSGSISANSSFFTTDGSTAGAGSNAFYVRRYDPSGALVYSTIIDGNASDLVFRMTSTGQSLFISGATGSTDYPVTNGSTYVGIGDTYLTQFDANGNITFSTYIGGNGKDDIIDLETDGTHVYLYGATTSTNFPTTDGSGIGSSRGVWAIKYDLNGNIIYGTVVSGNTGLNAYNEILIQNGEVYFMADVNGPNNGYPVVNGLPYSGTGKAIIYTKLDANGGIAYSTFYGGTGNVQPDPKIAINENGELFAFIFARSSDASDYFTTDGSTGPGAYIVKYNPDGTICAATVINDFGASLTDISVDKNIFYATGDTVVFASTRGDLSTDASVLGDNSDFFIAKYHFCPEPPALGADVLSPPSQAVCSNEIVERIVGEELVIDGTIAPQIYVGGIQQDQQDVVLMYQWQSAPSAAGPWTDVSGPLSQLQNYSPPPTAQDIYYRRLTKEPECCGGTIVSTSTITEILVSADEAPEVAAGGTFYNCPGASIDIGGSPSASGGAGGYIYDWNNGTFTIANPTVNPTTSSIYTLRVTDAAGCIQADQATVTIYAADAGANRPICNGEVATLGGLPLAGVPIVDEGNPLPNEYSIAYTWTGNTASLSCTNCPNPNSTPADNTSETYTLTVTIYQPDGTPCSSTDDVTINAGGVPTNLDFAGPDGIVCKGVDYPLGLAPEAGFNYAWGPGIFVTSSTGTLDQSSLTFNSGIPDDDESEILLGFPNPFTYTVGAEKDGCVTYDQVSVAVIEARAHRGGDSKCGPAIIGLEDRTPDIDETYSWSILPNLTTGDSQFLGAMDEPQIPVSANTAGGITAYELAVSYTFGGTTQTCLDTVYIVGCGGCDMDFDIDNGGCPNDIGAGITVSAVGGENLVTADFDFAWTPQAGLNVYDSNIVQLTDNVARTYTVVATSKLDPTFTCTLDVPVNQPGFAVPVFNADSPIITCPGESVTIGDPINNPNYIYEWSPDDFLNNPAISNPTANVDALTDFVVTITDPVTGCTATDTITVDVGEVANAGSDIYVCDNGIVTLGSPEIPGYVYEWAPVLDPSDYQNGTNQNSAQPEIFVATNLTFTLTMTSPAPAKCVSTDKVEVIVNPIPPGFTLPDLSFCPSSPPVILGFDNADGTGTNNVPAGFTYEWSPAAFLIDASAQNPTLISPLPSSDLAFSLKIISGGGCNSVVEQNLFLNVGIAPPETSSNQTICADETVDIGAASNPTGIGITYTWIPNDGNLSDPSSPNPTFSTSDTGTYSYTVIKNDNGCITENEVTITVIDVMLPLITDNYTICQGTSLVLGPDNPEVGLSYQWTPATGLDDANIANPMFIGTSSVNYTLAVINSLGCIAEVPVTVAVFPELAPVISINDITACASTGSVVLDATISPPGNYAYQWSPSDFLSSTSVEDPTLFLTSLGLQQYTLTVINQDTGCSNEATVNVEVFLTGCCEVPEVTASALSASCADSGSNDDAYLQIGTATDATHYDFNVGSTYTGSGFAGATAFDPMTDLPLQFGTTANPAVATDYTIRVFNGADDCFTDLVVTLAPANCCPTQNCFGITIQQN